jgi:threonine dehydrogenase-like Zn-dependent dehydrogenase
MKAVVLKQAETLVHQEVPTPEPGPGEVLMRVQATSICGSDVLRVFHGHAKVMPIILGHEAAGVIEAVGDSVPADLIGKRAALAPLIPDMTCDACQRGLYACCQNYSFIGSRQNGSFAQFVTLPAQNAVVMPEGLDLRVGALIEPTTVTIHALQRAAFTEGMRVAVLGVGSIGLLTVQMARYLGAAQIVASDVSDDRLQAAEEFGASVLVNPQAGNAAERIRQATGGGVDVAVEAAGSPAALQQAVHSARPGGHVVLVGNQPQEQSLPLTLVEHIMRQELNLHGSWMSYSAPFPGSEWEIAVEAMQQDAAYFQRMISHQINLVALPEMFASIHSGSGQPRKIVIEPN